MFRELIEKYREMCIRDRHDTVPLPRREKEPESGAPTDQLLAIDLNRDGASDIAAVICVDDAVRGDSAFSTFFPAQRKYALGDPSLYPEASGDDPAPAVTFRAGNSFLRFGDDYIVDGEQDAACARIREGEGQQLFVRGYDARSFMEWFEALKPPYKIFAAPPAEWPTEYKRISSEWNSECKGEGPWMARVGTRLVSVPPDPLPAGCDETRYFSTQWPFLPCFELADCRNLQYKSTQTLIKKCVSALQKHRGLDIVNPDGRPVYATQAGTLVIHKRDNINGNWGCIKHGDGKESCYVHTLIDRQSSDPFVVTGEYLGRSDGSPNVDPHLHYRLSPTPAIPLGDPWDGQLNDAAFTRVGRSYGPSECRGATPPQFYERFPITDDYPVCGMHYPRRGTEARVPPNTPRTRINNDKIAETIVFPEGWPECAAPRPSF